MKSAFRHSLYLHTILAVVGSSPVAARSRPESLQNRASGSVAERTPGGRKGTDVLETQHPGPRQESDIVVTGKREKGVAIGDDPPVRSVGRQDIEAMGVDTVNDVITAMQGPGGGRPEILLNGKRVGGMAAVQYLPAEAILRVDMLSDVAARRYGFQDGRPVVNVVTVPDYRAARASQTTGMNTTGVAGTSQSGTGYTRLAGSSLLNLSMNYTFSDAIAEKSGSTSGRETPYNSIGNLIAPDGRTIDPALDLLAGRAVTIAGVPGASPTLADFLPYIGGRSDDLVRSGRSLRPETGKLEMSAILSGRMLGQIVSTLTLGIEETRERASLGFAPATFMVAAGNRFSPLSSDASLYRYLDEVADLRRTGTNRRFQLGATFSGTAGQWTWSVIGAHGRNRISAITDQGIGTAAAQQAIDQGLVDPFDKITSTLLADRQRIVSRSTEIGTSANATVYGSPFRLPTGATMAVFTASAEATRLRSDLDDGVVRTIAIPRDSVGGTASLDLPVASKADGILPFLGHASINLNAGASRISQFGTTWSYGSSFSVNPGRIGFLNIGLSEQRTAPGVVQLSAPVLTNPNTPVFDYTRGIATSATLVSGGNPDLAAEQRRAFTALLVLTLPRGAQLSVNYTASHTRHVIGSVPAATPAIEAALPERFVRGAGGTLERIDSRPINFERGNQTQLESSLFLSRPIGKPPMPSAGAMIGARTQDADEPAGQLTIRLSHSWRLRDRLRVRAGMPTLDLLRGDVVGSATGKPRHEARAEINRNANGIGSALTLAWQGPAPVNTDASTGRLRASALLKVNARIFGTMEQLTASPIAKGMRITLSVDNLFDKRIIVTDAAGDPLASYNPSYVDPVGRFASLSVRKLF